MSKRRNSHEGCERRDGHEGWRDDHERNVGVPLVGRMLAETGDRKVEADRVILQGLHGLVRHGLVWYGLMRYRLVRYGLMWQLRVRHGLVVRDDLMGVYERRSF